MDVAVPYKISHSGTPFAPIAGGVGRKSSVLVPLPVNLTIQPGEKFCLDTGVVFDWPRLVYGTIRLCPHLTAGSSGDTGLIIDESEPVLGTFKQQLRASIPFCSYTLLIPGLSGPPQPLQVWVKHLGQADVRIRAGDFSFEVRPVHAPHHNGFCYARSMIRPILSGETVIQMDSKKRAACKPVAIAAVSPRVARTPGSPSVVDESDLSSSQVTTSTPITVEDDDDSGISSSQVLTSSTQHVEAGDDSATPSSAV